MGEIVLIGDSIRMGYQATVKAELADLPYAIWCPEENGGNTVNLLTYFHLWIQRRQPALVHINAGLHDLKTIYYGARQNLIPVEHYRQNVRKLLQAIQTTTQAKIIWALTTPVQDAAHNTAHKEWQDFCRYDADVPLYNAAASSICQELGVAVNDLCSVAREAGLAKIQTADGVHYNETGCAILGKVVAKFIRATL
ncbi:MAG: GDSL-type esterase/lipase family protein [Phycisphaerae bacterium]